MFNQVYARAYYFRLTIVFRFIKFGVVGVRKCFHTSVNHTFIFTITIYQCGYCFQTLINGYSCKLHSYTLIVPRWRVTTPDTDNSRARDTTNWTWTQLVCIQLMIRLYFRGEIVYCRCLSNNSATQASNTPRIRRKEAGGGEIPSLKVEIFGSIIF